MLQPQNFSKESSSASAVGTGCFPQAQQPVVTLGTRRPHKVGTAAPPETETSGAQRFPRYHLPTETRAPFKELTGATGSPNNKLIHREVFVTDKGLGLSLMLFEGFG